MATKDHQKMSFYLLTIVIYAIYRQTLVYSITLSSEVDVLRALKEGVDPNSTPSNSFISTWDFTVDPCESTGAHFLGILCTIPDDNSSSRITILDVDGVGLPDGLKKLKRIQELDISQNKLNGLIPNWIANFRSLESLRMAGNGFSGRIPNMAGLWQLNTLDLSNNQFFGILPQLPVSLRILSLSHNVISGSIHSVWELRNLRRLDLSDNRFSGRIRGIMNLPELISLNLSVNWFTELQVPKFTGESTNLEVLDVQQNRLTGHLPGNLATMEKLTTICLSHNQLSGPIPQSFGSRLGAPWKLVYFDNNFLVGGVPAEFGLQNIKVTGSLAHNCLLCPKNVSLCDGGQRPASECAGQSIEISQEEEEDNCVH